MITYQTSVETITPEQLVGFFVGWPNKPDQSTHLRVLQQSNCVVIAMEDGGVVGFITAISDGVLSAYIPFLEVLPEYQKKGIGRELMKRMIEQLEHLYMIDLLCDPDMQEFYTKFGMHKATGMSMRNYDKQNGKKI